MIRDNTKITLNRKDNSADLEACALDTLSSPLAFKIQEHVRAAVHSWDERGRIGDVTAANVDELFNIEDLDSLPFHVVLNEDSDEDGDIGRRFVPETYHCPSRPKSSITEVPE